MAPVMLYCLRPGIPSCRLSYLLVLIIPGNEDNWQDPVRDQKGSTRRLKTQKRRQPWPVV
eukprot:scaffold244775_cov19-Prasinocladus_malaysianus.AAC.1